MVEAVVFDMDGILFDTERVAADAWREACAKLGFSISAKTLTDILGIDERDARRILTEAFGGSIDYDEARRLNEEAFDGILEREGIPVKPGVRELLGYLGASGIPAAVASSSDRYRVEKNLGLAGITGSFKSIVSGNDGSVARGKPEPDIFLAAARALGIAPERCMAFEDSRSGVCAAKRAGMMTVMVPDLYTPMPEDREGLFALIPVISDAIELIKKENGK